MSLIDGKTHIATDEVCALPWNGHRSKFRCNLCGHRFKPGDSFRFVYTNDMRRAGGNPLVCEACDGEDVRERWAALWEEWRSVKDGKFWWFAAKDRGTE